MDTDTVQDAYGVEHEIDAGLMPQLGYVVVIDANPFTQNGHWRSRGS